MVTLDQLKNETAANLEKEELPDMGNAIGYLSSVSDDVIDVFMDVLEANNGTLKFSQPPDIAPRKVPVGIAGEKSGVGR